MLHSIVMSLLKIQIQEGENDSTLLQVSLKQRERKESCLESVADLIQTIKQLFCFWIHDKRVIVDNSCFFSCVIFHENGEVVSYAESRIRNLISRLESELPNYLDYQGIINISVHVVRDAASLPDQRYALPWHVSYCNQFF